MPKKPVLDPELFTRTQVRLPDFEVALERYGDTEKNQRILGIPKVSWEKINKKIILFKEECNLHSIACLFSKEYRGKPPTALDCRTLLLSIFTKAQQTAIKKYFKEED